MRLVLVLSFATILASAAETAPAPQPSTDDLVQRVLSAQRGITTVSGSFTQHTGRINDPDQDGQTFAARFDLHAPDKYNIVYTKPGDDEYRLRYCSDGTQRVQTEQIIAGQQPDTTVRPVVAGDRKDDVMRRMSALFRLDPVAISKDFTIAPRRVGDLITVELRPREPGLAEHITGIEVDLDASYRTKAVRMDDPQGNRTTIVIEEAVYNPTLPPETFTAPPAP